MIVKKKDGYYVVSEKRHLTASGKLQRRNLGGPYATREEAIKRLQQVEFFKQQK